jgi:dihydroorotate dehydrogenase (NAD+) catalytic subunit
MSGARPGPTDARLGVSLLGVSLSSPLVLASGILGVSASSMGLVAGRGVGAVTTKSFGLDERSGHPGPAIVAFDHGVLNAVGLSNPGWELATAEIRAFKGRSRTPIIASIFGQTAEEYALIAERAAGASPDLVEVNVSCPNVASEFGTPFEAEPKVLARIVRDVKRAAGTIPVSIKLSANFGIIAAMARICADHGADAITAINTVGPGMLIDVDVRRPVLSNQAGGVSGPCILPIAVRSVFEITKAVQLPVIGTGGVASAEDVLQLIMAGATAVGVGTALRAGLGVIEEIHQGLAAFLDREGIASLEAVRGAAHV